MFCATVVFGRSQKGLRPDAAVQARSRDENVLDHFSWSAPPAEDRVKTANQNREKPDVRRRDKKNHDKSESTGDEPVRQVPMPEPVEQKQMNRDERCDEEGEQPASAREAVMFHHGFVPFVKITFPTAVVGASART